MCIPIKIEDKIVISKEKILTKYENMDEFFKNCIKALYGDAINSCEIKCYLLCNIIREKQNGRDKLSILEDLKDKTGIYIFLNNDNIPVYIGIGGKKIGGKQDLKIRISQELRAYAKNGETSSYPKDSGATLSKNIQEIDSIFNNRTISPDDSIKIIKSFSLLVIIVGNKNEYKFVEKSIKLETILIALFHPKYNK